MPDEGDRYNPGWVIVTMGMYALTMGAYWWWIKPTGVMMGLLGVAFFFMFLFLAMMLSFEGYKADGSKKSMLYGLKWIATRLPSVNSATRVALSMVTGRIVPFTSRISASARTPVGKLPV